MVVGLTSSPSVSIHAPVKDATCLRNNLPKCQKRFNPRTRKGCDVLQGWADDRPEVSIHAPVKDATTLG